MCNDYPQIIPIEYLEIEPNFYKLPDILDKLHIKNKKIRLEIIKNLENKENNRIIIELLDELSDMIGKPKNNMNLYRWYCINRDLKQNGSPVFHENKFGFDTIQHWPHDNLKVTAAELIKEYEQIVYKKGLIPTDGFCPITKGDLESVLQYLLNHDAIYTYNVGDLFNDPSHKEDEYCDVLDSDFEMNVLKVY